MRRRARECALQMLYQLDVSQDFGARDEVGGALQRYWDSFDPVSPEEREFAERLVRGVVDRVGELDGAIEAVSKNWRLQRMARVDRNLLRMAAYEILHCPDIPRSASINEAIELGKRFSTHEAASFVNGILDQLEPEVRP